MIRFIMTIVIITASDDKSLNENYIDDNSDMQIKCVISGIQMISISDILVVVLSTMLS